MTPSEILTIKEQVRARDAYRCVECGLTNAEHIRLYGSCLEVHRLTPGSPYVCDDSCQTLCIPCHGPKPRRARGRLLTEDSKIFARISDELGELLEAYLASLRPRPTKTEVINVALEDFLIARGYLPPSP